MMTLRKRFETHVEKNKKKVTVSGALSLNPSLQNFKMWLTQNKNAIPLDEAVANA